MLKIFLRFFFSFLAFVVSTRPFGWLIVADCINLVSELVLVIFSEEFLRALVNFDQINSLTFRSLLVLVEDILDDLTLK